MDQRLHTMKHEDFDLLLFRDGRRLFNASAYGLLFRCSIRASVCHDDIGCAKLGCSLIPTPVLGDNGAKCASSSL